MSSVKNKYIIPIELMIEERFIEKSPFYLFTTIKVLKKDRNGFYLKYDDFSRKRRETTKKFF